ncbi:HPP family protein [Vibrio japonicus]|uniref:CBS domain-containing protein n=1 Tax=Vibrio japonicus TaxID=1824638 RepID=A0ABY5LPD8_9VIBR|nr:CBS domain-containing protein [Vibrio japonicus]UUM32805.1 CBS domain-containing protein [Vibrio japonicus]
MPYANRLLNLLHTIIAVLISSTVVSFTALYGHSYPYAPLLIASIGASITIIFVIPSSPMGRTWPLVAGHVLAALIGVVLSSVIENIAVLALVTITSTIFAMILLKCVHPPGVATALVPVLSTTSQPVNLSFLLDPVLLNVVPLAVCGIVFRWWLSRQTSTHTEQISSKAATAHSKTSLYFEELHQVVETRNEWLDIDEKTLDEIFKQTHLLALEHKNEKLTCEHVMTRDILTLKETDTVYDGLKQLQQNKYSAIPIVNTSNEVLGIFSLVDFLLYVEQRKINSFVGLYLLAKKRTSKTIGQYMKRNPISIHQDQHIARLIPYLTSGFHHIPIINDNNQLVGMVTQSDLIEFLYNLNQ